VLHVDQGAGKNSADGKKETEIVEESEPATPKQQITENRRMLKTEESRVTTVTPEGGREETNSIMKPKIALNNLDKIQLN